MEEITFEEWVKQEQKSLAEFYEWWYGEHRKNPTQYPLEMDAGEWDEQYRAWQA